MNLPPDFNELVLEPDETPIAESFICACCEGVTQTAFGYVGNSVTGFDEKPTVYLVDSPFDGSNLHLLGGKTLV
jgi:hypothetical protein